MNEIKSASTAAPTSGDSTTPSSGKAEDAGSAGLVSFADSMNGREAQRLDRPASDSKEPVVRRGPDRKPRRRRNRAATVVDEANVAALHAAGVSRNKIVEVLDLTKTRVDEILRRPEVREFAGRVRQAIQVQQLATVQETLDSTSQWLQDVIRSRDPKAFDAITRGLAALERVASSASGENQRFQATVDHSVNPNVSDEAKALVAALLGTGTAAPPPKSDPGAR